MQYSTEGSGVASASVRKYAGESRARVAVLSETLPGVTPDQCRNYDRIGTAPRARVPFHATIRYHKISDLASTECIWWAFR